MNETSIVPGSWRPWAARPELMPICKGGDPCWIVEAGDGPSYHGGWDLDWHHIEPGQWYRATVACLANDVPHVHDSAHVELIWWQRGGGRADWAHVRYQEAGNGLLVFAHEAQAPADATALTMRLMLRWTAQGKVGWTVPRLVAIAPPKPRAVKAAIATGKFPGDSVEANLAYAVKLIARAADAGAHVVCLPECITTWRTKDLPKEGARPIPGPETDALGDEARRRNVDVVCSMYELNGDLIHNTGLYVCAKEGLLGKYRKVHLAVGERWRGITPGDEFPLWQTRHGKAGMLICFDSVMPEGHRILSQKGAEMLFMPIMGDPRAIGDHAAENWRDIMRVRAMDNHVWFVVCQNRGEWGMIVRPDGHVVAEADPGTGFALAEIDLNFRFKSRIGSDFENRVWAERRPHLYGRLTGDV